MTMVSTADLVISKFNSRKTRPAEQVERLAERMKRNGFESTRALWVRDEGGALAVFAGGTRLEAAKVAGLDEVPVIVFDADDDEIARLETLDNENDEYHAPVPITDVWAEFARLAGLGWTQQRIADAKGCAKSLVSERIKWHSSLPEKARAACSNGLVDEGHLREVSSVGSNVRTLSDWLTTEQAQTELVDEVLGKHRGSKAGVKPTVKMVREAAKRWKALIAAAEKAHAALPEGQRELFVERLAKHEVRDLGAISRLSAQLLKEEAARREAEADETRAAANREEARQAFAARCVHGNAIELIEQAPEGFHLLLTDPPYGMGYQSGRRVGTAKKKRIESDDLEDALDLLNAVLDDAVPRMAADAHVLVFTGWRHEPAFRKLIEDVGLTIRGSLVWEKNNHGTGDLRGSFAPKHERIIHAVKGNPAMAKRIADVLHAKDVQNSDHPTEKPVLLLQQLIEATTTEGQVVVDPFMGSGSTLFAAHLSERDFWGCELEETWYRAVVARLLDIFDTKEAA